MMWRCHCRAGLDMLVALDHHSKDNADMNTLSAQLLEAASLMGLGMAFVFAFLSLAIVAVKLLARLAGEDAPAPVAAAAPAVAADQGPGPQTLAAIAAAITQYKNNHKP